jgi:O-antigen ligase
VLLTLSRAGLIALALVLLVGIMLAGRWRTRAITVTVIAALGVVSYFAFFTTPYERERITRVQGGAGRIDLWTVGWRMAEDKPLTGVGAGNYKENSPKYLISEPGPIVRDDFILDRPKETHNIYLQVLAELGVPGLLLFLSVIGFSLVCTGRAARAFKALGERRLQALAWAFLLALIAILVTDFFQSEQFSKQLWLLLALGPALLALSRRLQTPEPST